MGEVLKPCPFCGGKPFVYQGRDATALWKVICENCDAGPSMQIGEQGAREAWNRRFPLLPDVSGMAEPVKPTTINVNDCFAVRLMKGGYEQLVKATTIWEDRSTGVKYAEACHPEKPDGTRHFQLHELMRFFGPLMFNGNNELPFETTIEYLGDGLSAPPASDLREENETRTIEKHRRDLAFLLSIIDAMSAATGESPDEEDAAILDEIREEASAPFAAASLQMERR